MKIHNYFLSLLGLDSILNLVLHYLRSPLPKIANHYLNSDYPLSEDGELKGYPEHYPAIHIFKVASLNTAFRDIILKKYSYKRMQKSHEFLKITQLLLIPPNLEKYNDLSNLNAKVKN